MALIRIYRHRVQCAVRPDCTFVWEDEYQHITDTAIRMLNLNGWWFDDERWHCGRHEQQQRERRRDAGTTE